MKTIKNLWADEKGHSKTEHEMRAVPGTVARGGVFLPKLASNSIRNTLRGRHHGYWQLDSGLDQVNCVLN
jgi:hypothetical protein